MNSKDYVIRATAAQGQIRGFAATTRNMVEEARSRHNTSPVMTAALGRLLTAGAMMGAMMKGERDSLTLKIQGDGPAKSLTVIADSHGNVKGFAQEPQVLLPANEKGKLDVAKALGIGVLTVSKDLGLREPYVGSSILVTSEIAEDLTYYFATSEQTPSSVGLGVLMNRENTVRQAGGFLLQLMPDIQEETIDRLEKTIGSMDSVTSMLDRGMTPEAILTHLLGDFDLEILETTDTRFSCDCSREKVHRAVKTIGKTELCRLAEEGEPVEAHCDFCNSSYWFAPEDLLAMANDESAADKDENIEKKICQEEKE